MITIDPILPVINSFHGLLSTCDPCHTEWFAQPIRYQRTHERLIPAISRLTQQNSISYSSLRGTKCLLLLACYFFKNWNFTMLKRLDHRLKRPNFIFWLDIRLIGQVFRTKLLGKDVTLHRMRCYFAMQSSSLKPGCTTRGQTPSLAYNNPPLNGCFICFVLLSRSA